MEWDDRFRLGGFSDEVCTSKSLETQLSVCAALGMTSVTLRFLDMGNGIRNILDLNEEDAARINGMTSTLGLRVGCIGSPLGKVKLHDQADGTSNRFRPLDQYLAEEVERACQVARWLDCRLIRGFSFYHPAGSDPDRHVDAAIERLRPIVERCDAAGLTFGLEVEANLVGQNGSLLSRIHAGVNHPGLVLVFDGANLVTQGYRTDQVLEQWQQMLPGLGWIHVKDYRQSGANPDPTAHRHLDEEALDGYVPAGEGNSGYGEILQQLKLALPEIRQRLVCRSITDVLVDLEPHVAGGGQFGGYSGPQGFARSLKALRRLLDRQGIAYQ